MSVSIPDFGHSRHPRRARARIALLAALLAMVATVGVAAAAVSGFNPFSTQQVGNTYANGVLLPTNQWVSPLGTRVLDTSERLTSGTISPDGNYEAALGWNDFSGYLTIVNLQTDQIVARHAMADKIGGSTDYSVSPDGPLFSPDGSTIWVPQSGGIARFNFSAVNGSVAQTAFIPLCGSATTSTTCNPNDGPTSPSGDWIPSGMALSPDGSTLYVALNGDNSLGEINTATNTLTSRIAVGNAPRQVVLADNGTVAYVSNEGGYPADGNPDQFTNLSDGTPIVSSQVTGAATTGTVSVVNLQTGTEEQEIGVGLQPTAMYQDGSALFVANSNDDSVSVINEATNTVAQTVKTNPVPGASVGSYANAITLDGSNLLVSIGRDNAIGVYRYSGLSTPVKYEGLLPTDWYPVGVAVDPTLGKNEIIVTNDKGIGARGPATSVNKGPDTQIAADHNTYDDTGSITRFVMPSLAGVAQNTKTVFRDNDWNQIKSFNNGTYDTVSSVIPKTLGGASPIKHIMVIVKENRTYDQIYGNLGEGNGDPADAQFGAGVTPNFQALAKRFGDLDNFYDEGTLSADGHNWIVQAEANDYVEKEFGAFYRSYPSQGGDSLAYQRDGFLWNAAEKAGKSVQNFGEYMYNPYSLPASTPTWDQFYAESQWLQDGHQGAEPVPDACQYIKTESDIPSLNAITDHCFPNFQLGVPDQYRVDTWLPTFQKQEKSGKMPSLSFMWLMSDHTMGVGEGDPDPVAEVADNDLAVGRVVSEISHSKFWKSTAIFVVEDDTQNGVDHVDGHRGPIDVISPYSKPGVDDQYYSQINLVKTIEQIEGIKAMNQEDLAAEPMYDAFQAKPNDAPYTLQPNQVPLTLGAPGFPATLTAPLRRSAQARADFKPQGLVPADMRSVYEAWVVWSKLQKAEGRYSHQDRVNPAQENRLDWYSAHNWSVAYPGDKQIYLPNQVPGRKLPAAFIGDN
jgi:YVTN family beta-propeller protein